MILTVNFNASFYAAYTHHKAAHHGKKNVNLKDLFK